MGRKSLLVSLIFALGLSACSEGSSAIRPSDIVLMPHHLIVKPIIEDVYDKLAKESWEDTWPEVIIICPDHFQQGASHISTPPESEFGCQIHQDFVEQTWPGIKVTSYMIQTNTTEDEVDTFVEELATHPALFIFSVDFSHYLAGDLSYVHDQRSMDVLRARSVEDARSLEVDSPIALEIMLKLLAARDETLEIDKNTNPAYDAGITTFDNTTHVFAHSRALASGEAPPTRTVNTTMWFAHSKEWYTGKTKEDRYLYGYDEVFWDQGGQDHATIKTTGQPDREFTFDYFQ